MTDQAEDTKAEIVHLPSQRRERRELMAGAAIKPIIPQSLEEAFRLATARCQAGMAPKGMETPEKCLIAIMFGLEVGLAPMQAMERIAVINGRPVIWGDAAIGLVRASGKAEYIKEWFTGTGDNFTAHCETKRRGEQYPISGTFSVQDAKTAGLWGKRGHNGATTPWVTNPKRMLQMRARGFTLRDGYADILGGMYLGEEFDASPDMRDITPTPEPSFTPPTPPGEATMQPPAVRAPSEGKTPPEPRGTRRAREAAAELEAEVLAETLPTLTNDEADNYLADLKARVKACPLEEIEAIYSEYVTHIQSRMFPPDQQKAEDIFGDAYDRAADENVK